jgi:Na+/pantothenate symporter
MTTSQIITAASIIKDHGLTNINHQIIKSSSHQVIKSSSLIIITITIIIIIKPPSMTND